ALLIGIAVSAAFLLTPSRFTPAIPGDDALGTLFSGTLKANRDYDVLDPDTTAEKRDEAARSVWPVYDFDGSAAETLQRRISGAFIQGREAMAQWKQQNPAKAARLLTEHRIDAETARFLLSHRDEFCQALRPNLAYDDAETRRRQEAKRAQVKDVLLQVRKGEKIIGDGEQVTKTHLLVFQALRAAGRASGADQVRWGGGLFAALLCAVV